jgi:hypothetical protein
MGLLHSTVVTAADEDADVYRAVTRWEMQLDPADALLCNTAIVERARALAATRPPSPPSATGPSRESLLELIAANGA